MQYLTQNWTWVLIAAAALVFFFLRRGRRSGSSDSGLGGLGKGDDGHYQHHDHEDAVRPEAPSLHPPEAVIDPVNGSAVRTAGACTSVYLGKAYYFASKENRDRFEAAPQDYAAKVQGVEVEDHENADRPHRRHHGC
jgi:YHS domain-containing protein